MTHKERLSALKRFGWQDHNSSGRHSINNEPCVWIVGMIDGVSWTAWMGERSGMVYLHTAPGIDLEFQEFIAIVENGWPEKKATPAEKARTLFDVDCE